MAKKLIYDYTIDAAANKISVKGNHRIETLLIITDITAGKIVYKIANESFGVVILEAMKHSKAVICTDFGGMKEVVEDGSHVPSNTDGKMKPKKKVVKRKAHTQ